MNDAKHKQTMIVAENLLRGLIPTARDDYQRGWNDALQTAYEVETEEVRASEQTD